MATEAVAVIVERIVQRVGFRRFAERTAREFGLAGYAENLRDGTVKLFLQGEGSSIEGFVKRVQQAPPPMLVENVLTKKSRPNTKIKKNHFQIKPGRLVEEIQEGFGAMEAQFSDYRGEFKEYRGDFNSFAERTDSNFKSLDTKYGEISAKLTEILKSLQTENVEAIQSLNRSVDTLVKAVERLSPRSNA